MGWGEIAPSWESLIHSKCPIHDGYFVIIIILTGAYTASKLVWRGSPEPFPRPGGQPLEEIWSCPWLGLSDGETVPDEELCFLFGHNKQVFLSQFLLGDYLKMPGSPVAQ